MKWSLAVVAQRFRADDTRPALRQPIRLGGAVENGRACSVIEQACFSIAGRGTLVPAEIVAGAKASEMGVRENEDAQFPQPTQVQLCDGC